MDIIKQCIGSFGKYQAMVYCLMFLSRFPVAWQQLGVIFLAPPASYICTPPGKPNVCPCPNPVFDRTIFTNTIIMEWHIICERAWMGPAMQSLLQLGILMGSIMFGMTADRHGRKVAISAAVIVMLVSGMGVRFARNYWTFTILRMFCGVAVGGFIVIGFVMVMEFTATEYRPHLAAITNIPFNIGHISVAGFGYFFRDFSDFHFAICVPVFLLLAYFVLLPESPMWLLATKQTEKAIPILNKAAKMNGLPRENIASYVAAYQAMQTSTVAKKGTICDLFRTPNIRRNIICMSIQWCSVSYFFYGVSQFIGHMCGNIFVNVAISGFVGMCGSIISIYLMKHYERKLLVIGLHMTGGVCMLFLALIPSGSHFSVAFACVGVLCMFANFDVVFLFATELFPTVVRSNAMGICSMMARVGSMIAPPVISMNSLGAWCAPVAFALGPFLACVACMFIPETRGSELMTTLEQGENFGKRITPPTNSSAS